MSLTAAKGFRRSGSELYRGPNRGWQGAAWQAALLVVILIAISPSYAAKQPWPGSPLAIETQIQLERAGRYMKSGKFERAEPIILSALEQAGDLPKCLAIAAFTDAYGQPMANVRRQCVQKAFSLCQNREDLIQVALKSRQYEFYEITREAIQALIGNAKTIDDLYDVARKAQEVALNDVAHLAMERAYTGVKSVPDALKFAKEVKALGMDDLARKVAKDLIDDEDNAHYLVRLLAGIEPLGMKDLNRYLLKKALDKANKVEEFEEIWNAARRHREQDIYKVAEYRGKKLMIINKIKSDQAEYQRQLQAWREGAMQDLARQQAEAEQNMGPGKKYEGGSDSLSGQPAQEAPGSGF